MYFADFLPRAFSGLPWVPEVFLACDGNFRCLAEGRHIFGRRPKPRAAKRGEARRSAGHYKDLTETGNRARNVSGTQGISGPNLLSFLPIYSGTGLSLFWGLSIQETLSFRRVSNSQWGGGFYGYRQKFWLFYGYRLIFFNYG